MAKLQDMLKPVQEFVAGQPPALIKTPNKDRWQITSRKGSMSIRWDGSWVLEFCLRGHTWKYWSSSAAGPVEVSPANPNIEHALGVLGGILYVLSGSPDTYRVNY